MYNLSLIFVFAMWGKNCVHFFFIDIQLLKMDFWYQSLDYNNLKAWILVILYYKVVWLINTYFCLRHSFLLGRPIAKTNS